MIQYDCDDGRDDSSNDEIGTHARVTYSQVENAGPAARPLEFPAPSVHPGARITLKACEPTNGKIYLFRNVLVRISSDHRKPQLTHDAFADVGYCIRRKLSDSVFGSVRLCVVMRRRAVAQQERFLFRAGGGSGNGASQRSLDVIGEEDKWEDKDEENYFNLGDGDVQWEATSELVAVKIVSWAKMRFLRGKHLEDPIKEVASMQLLGDYHPNIISSIEVLQDEKYLYSVIPYCAGGDLYARIIDETRISKSRESVEAQARIWFRQIILVSCSNMFLFSLEAVRGKFTFGNPVKS
uniref:Protein kinase domain-containing protein n=1 Tax=Ditylum brightwellii TaxID=49249 RepID=A0A7S4R0C9_9STRA|mmetsp:Transcript_12341/g.16472  ORF Transcript_12341/g.16472 Transcript_12341/m.16472 type:complete len:295 (-) Transcript_12341:742-1626(-)